MELSASPKSQPQNQLTDALTKPLSIPRLSYLRPKIGVFDGSAILRGRVKDNGTNQGIKIKSNHTSAKAMEESHITSAKIKRL